MLKVARGNTLRLRLNRGSPWQCQWHSCGCRYRRWTEVSNNAHCIELEAKNMGENHACRIFGGFFTTFPISAGGRQGRRSAFVPATVSSNAASIRHVAQTLR